MNKPLRLRAVHHINSATLWLLHHIPRSINDWLHEPSFWDPRWGRWAAATICRTFGHEWVKVDSGDLLPMMMMCDGCHTFWNSDDPDAFHPGRDQRDAYLAVIAELFGDDPGVALDALHDADYRYRRVVSALHVALHADEHDNDERQGMARVLADAMGERGCNCRTLAAKETV